MQLSVNSINIFHILRQIYTSVTDIFLFNIPRGQYLDTEKYKILESIKDGSAMALKYNAKRLVFKKPNVLIVFKTRHLIRVNSQKIGGKYSRYQKIWRIWLKMERGVGLVRGIVFMHQWLKILLMRVVILLVDLVIVRIFKYCFSNCDFYCK